MLTHSLTLLSLSIDGVDYTGLPATDVYLNSAHDQSCVSVSILDDLIFEDTEFLNVSLTILGPKKRFLTLSQDVYIVYITNDDGKGQQILCMYVLCVFGYALHFLFHVEHISCCTLSF